MKITKIVFKKWPTNCKQQNKLKKIIKFTLRMKYIIFENSCWILERKRKICQYSLFSNSNFQDFLFGAKYIPKLQNFKKKKVKIIKLPYYLSYFIKKVPLFDIDLFSQTFDMKLPYIPNIAFLCQKAKTAEHYFFKKFLGTD